MNSILSNNSELSIAYGKQKCKQKKLRVFCAALSRILILGWEN